MKNAQCEGRLATLEAARRGFSDSFLESVLQEIEFRITSNNQKYDGNVNQLYKRVQKLLNLDPNRKDISDSLKQLLRGIVTIVAGIASIRNSMSDAHARSYKPSKHHAKLAVNSVYTICMFLLDSFEYQVKNSTIQIAPDNSIAER